MLKGYTCSVVKDGLNGNMCVYFQILSFTLLITLHILTPISVCCDGLIVALC